ncbi:MAG: hypothetical protein LBI99_02590 [Propionibacteriaceae bacterium]|nr:hypothetical protein [Propionibacteriaceae bacterium]
MRKAVAKPDASAVSRALKIKSISDAIPVIGGGIALVFLGYPWWGIACVAAAAFEILSVAIAGKAPRPSRAISSAVTAVQLATLFAGGWTLLCSGQLVGGVACLGAFAVKLGGSLVLMPWVERKYLSGC